MIININIFKMKTLNDNNLSLLYYKEKESLTKQMLKYTIDLFILILLIFGIV
jgi:hypothetical protein